MTAATVLERATAPLDGVRRALLRVLLPLPVLGSLLSRRDSRVALWASGHAIVAFALAATFPMLLFVLGPVLLGVVHVGSDVRYLVLRRKLPAWWKNVVWAGCLMLIALRGAEELGLRGLGAMRTEQLLVCGWMALALGAGARAAGAYRRATLALPVVAALAWACAADPENRALGVRPRAQRRGHRAVASPVP